MAAVLVVGLLLRNTRLIVKDFADVHTFQTERYNILNQISNKMMDNRRITSLMPFHQHNVLALSNLHRDVQNLTLLIEAHLDALAQNLLDDPLVDGHLLHEYNIELNHLRHLIQKYSIEVTDSLFATLGSTQIIANSVIQRYLELDIALYQTLSNQFNVIAEKTSHSIENRVYDLKTQADNDRVISLVISIITVTLGGVLAYFISKSLTKPLKEIANTIKEVSAGNLNVNTQTNLSKDESGK